MDNRNCATSFTKRLLAIAFLCLILFWSSAKVSAQQQTQHLAERLEELEKQLDRAQEREELSKELRKHIDDQIELIEKRYEQDIVKLRNDQDTFKNRVSSQTNGFFLFIFLVTTIGGWNIIRIISKKFDRKVDAFFQEKIRFMKELIESQEIESKARETKRILILGETAEQASGTKERFRQLGFKNLYPKCFNDVFYLHGERMANDFNENEFDLIVFSEMSEALIDSYMERSVKELFIGYTSSGHLTLKHREKISFANSPFTLYSRTMEVFKYQYVRERTL